MQVKDVETNSIKPYKNNAKKHSDTQIANVAESIRQFGFIQPVVTDEDGVIIIGHCRWLAAQKIGLLRIPVVSVNLSKAQTKKLRVLDNKLNESEWDIDMLFDDIAELEFDGFDIDWGWVNPEELPDDFSLPDNEQNEFETMTFTLHREQAEIIRDAIANIQIGDKDTFGNTNKNGNALYRIVKEWAEQNK